MTLFGLGTATVDIRITTADMGPEYRAKLLARETHILGGGAVANALCQASLLGATVEWLGALGDDRLGAMILQDLVEHQIGTAYVRRIESALSPLNLAVYAGDAQRRVGGFLLPNSLSEISDSDVDAWIEVVGPDDWCLVEVGEMPLPITYQFCSRARERGAVLVLDVDLDPLTQCVGGSRALVTELFSLVDSAMPNQEAMGTLYPNQPPAEIAKAIYRASGTPAILTAGTAGCFYTGDGGSVSQRHPPKTNVVDTVGAGDAFHGAFVWALMTAHSLEESVTLASICGAANCRAAGARTGMIDGESLMAMYNQRKAGGSTLGA